MAKADILPRRAAEEEAYARRAVPSLAGTAYASIKERILALELKPGQFVNEAALCARLGIGRMPVHQAVHRLMAEGLLDIMPRKGIIIGRGSLDEVLDLLEARGAVEPNIAALAAERASAAEVRAMKRLLAQSAKLLDQRVRGRFMAFDRAFHNAVAEAAGNRILVDAQRPLHERSILIWHLRIWQPDGLVRTQREHQAVLDAIAARDARGAREAMRTHLEALRRRILEGSDVREASTARARKRRRRTPQFHAPDRRIE
jgi:DNA-binding GntR family transcriptional regulator